MELVEMLNCTLGAPVVETAAGGSGGGGASLRAGRPLWSDIALEMDTGHGARSLRAASAAPEVTAHPRRSHCGCRTQPVGRHDRGR